jgi:hypothetical protein
MSDWVALFRKPATINDSSVESWFQQMAQQLLSGTQLVIANESHRFVEVEFYYCGEGHADPFTHRDPLQRECGRWYFHRTGGMYRSGSFKGFDLTFGDGTAFGGCLIRGIETPDGTLIDGPSLCVDYLIEKTKSKSVADLDSAIAGRVAWDADNPLYLHPASADRTLYRSGRVGLSLKKAKPASEMPRYLLRAYRYLSEPRRTSKGKAYLVLALHVQGMAPAAIQQITGCTKQALQRYLADFEEGRQNSDFEAFFGKDLSPKDLCRLHGVWHTKWSGKGTISE